MDEADMTTCDTLDDYLDGSLAADLRMRFATHLAECATCAAQVALQRRVDVLLARATREATSSGESAVIERALVERAVVERLVRQQRRQSRRRVAEAIFAAAAVLLAAAAVVKLSMSDAQPDRGGAVVASRVDGGSGAHALPIGEPVTQVTIHAIQDAIAVPISSDHPSVSIVWIYPTAQPVAIAAPAGRGEGSGPWKDSGDDSSVQEPMTKEQKG